MLISLLEAFLVASQDVLLLQDQRPFLQISAISQRNQSRYSIQLSFSFLFFFFFIFFPSPLLGSIRQSYKELVDDASAADCICLLDLSSSYFMLCGSGCIYVQKLAC